MKYHLAGKNVRTLGSHFIAPSADLIGDIELGDRCSVWFNAVIRADNDSIRIGAGSNVQDCAVLHVDPGVPMDIGCDVTIGHHVMLHGCTIGDGSLIGINAVVLNNAVIGKNCLIGANALVTENMEIPDNSLVLGSPAKVVKTFSDEDALKIRAGAKAYQDKIDVYNSELVCKND